MKAKNPDASAMKGRNGRKEAFSISSLSSLLAFLPIISGVASTEKPVVSTVETGHEES